ncbi:hypothetical protein QBC33DRAFT_174893 [Phialemonium atrogriseum]|uniref:Uncharacterized protein n=1 Tax=Phialemonium atrogriseum TaxID=1093897 RepID=A0AAJ0BVF1_9PEZI|nr:uncharacterized protein QBC33DRAFT_174893 [Phialemonium atrogriseum]KAK1765200.1 hypothetical protein QBC33DRAFT_174893 [Phialemonium atrogriseum]
MPKATMSKSNLATPCFRLKPASRPASQLSNGVTSRAHGAPWPTASSGYGTVGRGLRTLRVFVGRTRSCSLHRRRLRGGDSVRCYSPCCFAQPVFGHSSRLPTRQYVGSVNSRAPVDSIAAPLLLSPRQDIRIHTYTRGRIGTGGQAEGYPPPPSLASNKCAIPDSLLRDAAAATTTTSAVTAVYPALEAESRDLVACYIAG